jgi:thiol-disulfide isomerase/thioredoxin
MKFRRAAIFCAILILSACGREGGGSAANDPAADALAASPEQESPSATSNATTRPPAPATAGEAGSGAGNGTSAATAAQAAPASPPAPAAPAELAPIHRLVVRDLEGSEFPLSRLAGRPMIIEIWATWCGPCRKNRATVHELRPSLPKRIAIVGVSVDTGADLVQNFLRSNPANEFELMATPEFMAFVRERNPSPSIPKTMYVDAKGRVVDLAEGTQSAKWLSAMARNLR